MDCSGITSRALRGEVQRVGVDKKAVTENYPVAVGPGAVRFLTQAGTLILGSFEIRRNLRSEVGYNRGIESSGKNFHNFP